MKLNLTGSRNIWIMSMVIFVIVALSMLFSTYYMNLSIQAEEDAQTRRAAYKQLGENLADASDYLTAEVRYFAITGDIEHLYNYWEEIFVTRQREQAIETFESSNPPAEEREQLEQAKKYSDLLVETETYSMKLVLLSEGKTMADFAQDERLADYVSYVMSYDNMSETGLEPKEELRNKAIEILYDDNYEEYKTKIMSPIEEFNTLMNTRLDKEVEERKQGTKIGTIVQIILAIVSLLAIGFLLSLMNRLYIKPLKSYTKDISNVKEYSGKASKQTTVDISILRTKIVPFGSMELVQFAETFNQMIDMFFQQLRERINAQESMRKARNEAELANQAKSIFLAQMSHELRTPLNAVNGYTYLLEQTELTKEQAEYLSGIRHSSEGLLELINQILDFSKIEAGHLELECEPFSLRDVLRDVEAMFTQQAMQKRLRFTVETEGEIPECLEGDSLRLRQVLINLLSNAFKFTAEGSVSLKVQLLKKESECCLLHFVVADTGIGIEEEAREKIFQPFVQSDASITRKYGGTGLGIPICNEIIMLSGDKSHKLELESKLGEGSVFSFSMDYPYKEDVILSKTVVETQIPHFYGKKVLITDDSTINIKVQSKILSLCGIVTVKAESGAEAIQLLQEQKDIDLIFMDIRMPGMDGYETAKRIRQLPGYRTVPIIALTADAVPQVQVQAKEAGIDGILLKPVEQEKLFQLLLKYWEQSEETVVKQQEKLITEEENRTAKGEIIECFLLLHKKDKEKLQEYINKQNYTGAEELVHQLKGITGNLQCTALYQCCCKLQNELQEKRTDSFSSFLENWDRTIEELEKEQKEYAVSKDFLNEKEPDADLYEKLLIMCENNDTEVVSVLEQYKYSLTVGLSPEEREDLKKAALLYDFEKIRKYLERIQKEQKPEEQKKK